MTAAVEGLPVKETTPVEAESKVSKDSDDKMDVVDESEETASKETGSKDDASKDAENESSKKEDGADSKEEEPSTPKKKEEEPEEPEDAEKEKDEDFSYDKDKGNLVEKGAICLNSNDATFSTYLGYLNSNIFTINGDGFAQLFGGARATMGFKSGRYVFECKMLENPRTARVGFGFIDSNLYLDDKSAIGFESGGDMLWLGERKKAHNARFMKTDIVGILLNLDPTSKNFNTISLFLNGTRGHSDPMPLPDEWFEGEGEERRLKGALYPMVCCKGSAIECNFSGKIWKDFTFKVRSVGNALKKDIEMSKRVSLVEKSEISARDETVEVIIPIAFNNKKIIEKLKSENEEYIMLTKENLQEWGEKSGIRRPVGNNKWTLQCIDMPVHVLPLYLKQGKKYIISLKDEHNFLPSDRKDLLLRLAHGLNLNVKAVIDGDDIVEYVEKKGGQAGTLELNYYNYVALPLRDENFTSIEYTYSGELPTVEKTVETETGESKTISSKLTKAELVTSKLLEWRKDCKLKSKVDNLQRSSYFKTNMDKFNEAKKLMHKDIYEKEQKRALEKKKQEKEKQQRIKKEEKAKKAAEEKKRKEEARKKAQEERLLAGLEGDLPEDFDVDEGADKGKGKDDDEEEKEEEIVFPKVMDEFSEEDWMLAQLRVEMHFMLHAFRKDVNDPERVCFPAIHFGHYYNLYTNKNFNTVLSLFTLGKDDFDGLSKLVPQICKHTSEDMIDKFALKTRDTSLVQDYDLVIPALPEDTSIESLIEMTDEARQIRQDRMDAGDEQCVLKFTYKPYPQNNNYNTVQGGNNNQNNNNNQGNNNQGNRSNVYSGVQGGNANQGGANYNKMNSNNNNNNNQKRGSPSGHDNQNYGRDNKRQKNNRR